MSHNAPLSLALASWWGYVEGDPTVVGIVVLAVASLAIAYFVRRVVRERSPTRGRDDVQSRKDR